eukprot:14235923-Ditylum_brightwellii.AAC.1
MQPRTPQIATEDNVKRDVADVRDFFFLPLPWEVLPVRESWQTDRPLGTSLLLFPITTSPGPELIVRANSDGAR